MTREDFQRLKQGASKTMLANMERAMREALPATAPPEWSVLHSGNQSEKERPKPGIRIPKKREPNKTEAEYRWKLYGEFGHPGGPWEIKYEAISFKLPGGLYSPDWSVWRGNELILVVETKGAYRLHSAGASHRAFKEAAAAWPAIRFRYARKNKDGTWQTTELNTNTPKK